MRRVRDWVKTGDWRLEAGRLEAGHVVDETWTRRAEETRHDKTLFEGGSEGAFQVRASWEAAGMLQIGR